MQNQLNALQIGCDIFTGTQVPSPSNLCNLVLALNCSLSSSNLLANFKLSMAISHTIGTYLTDFVLQEGLIVLSDYVVKSKKNPQNKYILMTSCTEVRKCL